jgi:DNA-binding response OmpR family regulator
VIRVLHIDDEAPIRLLARVNLEAEGTEVIEAENGRTGVQLAKRERPDLILLGVAMPVLDGWQAAEELRNDEETRDIPVVFLTARSRLMDRARGLELGAVDYILKPFSPWSWPHVSAGCWNGSSAANATSCGARRSRSCTRSGTPASRGTSTRLPE